MATSAEPIIHRRPDGSINIDHYDSIARNLRAHDQRAALQTLTGPLKRLFNTFRSQPSTQMQSR